MLIAVLGIRQGLFQAVAESSAISQYNVELNLDRPTSARQLVHTALDVPGVSAAEAWGLVDAYRVYPDGRRGGSFVLAGLPAETEFSKPYVTAGERLRAGDAQGIFLTQDMRTLYPDLQVGSKFVVHVGNKDVEWRVVGFDGRQYAPLAFVDYADWERATGLYGYANRVVVKTERDDPMLENQVEQELLRAFTKQGLRVVSSFTLTQLNRISQSQLDILIGLLLAMAVLIALVGGLGLASMMSLSVMERTREIGILRALGARRGVLRRLVLGEGVLLALGSYVLAVPLSMPLMLVIGNTLGVIILKRPLPYNFSLAGAVVWLGLVVVIALVACWFPAQNVARLTIRETLAYAG